MIFLCVWRNRFEDRNDRQWYGRSDVPSCTVSIVSVIYIEVSPNHHEVWVFPTNSDVYSIKRCVIKVITKLPNSEQSYKGKVKTHNYINRQNQSTTGKLWFLVVYSIKRCVIRVLSFSGVLDKTLCDKGFVF